MKSFNPFKLPTKGTSLIEASAGTGKTFGMAALFVRWVLLEKKSVTRLLVLTFTKAATAELKTRLRARLSQILRLLQNRTAADSVAEIKADTFLQPLFEKLDANNETPARLSLRLRAALDEFDGAGIYTIHSFCRSVLNDEAFLCGAPFAVEQVEHQDAFIERCRDDFWRREIAADKTLAQLCCEEKLTPSKVLNDIKPYLNKPYLHYDIPQPSLNDARADLAACIATVKPLLTTCLADEETDGVIKETLDAVSEKARAKFEPAWRARIASNGMSVAEAAFWRVFPRLNHSKYQAPTFDKLFAALTADDMGALRQRENKLCLLHQDELTKNTKKGKALLAAEIAALAPLAALGQAFAAEQAERDKTVCAVRFGMLRAIDRGLEAEKHRSNRRSYDDLLLDVYRALTTSPYRNQLIQRLAASWDALMVDEFQDTDPIQYAIFKTAFAEKGVPLYLVGDPKQSIYRFRGADIFTYFQAVQDAGGQRYTLNTNYRAHKKLVNTVTALFKRENPFVHDHIAYPPIRSAHEHGKLSPALKALTVFQLKDRDDTRKSIPVEEARTRAAEICADHMAQILNRAADGGLHLGERALNAGDIAVLVRNHNEARHMTTALKRRGIDSVSIRRESVFAGEEAAALAALLRFWLDPQQTGLLRFVLAGVLFQYTAADIAALNRDDTAVTRHIETARHTLTLWQEAGLFAAYQYFNRVTALEQRLIRRRAERTLTNLFQLLELLAQAAGECFGERALVSWLDQEIQAAQEGRGEQNLLRLENDESLVKIITIHKSKGLQYPLVYCPFVCMAQKKNTHAIEKIHDAQKTVLRDRSQLQKEDQNAIKHESLSEDLRLLYVALTRASEALVLCTDERDGLEAGTLPVDYLLHAHAPNATLWAAWQTWAASAGTNTDTNTDTGTDIELSTELPDFTAFRAGRRQDTAFHAKPLPERDFGARRLTSFSAWERAVGEAEQDGEELFSVDVGEQLATPAAAAGTEHADAHTFPGGIQAGLCWHAVLQFFDFARPAAEQRELIARQLSVYGFDADTWCEALIPMFENTRLAQLGTHCTLADIPRRHRLPENGFLLDKIRFDPQAVLHYLGDTLPAVIGEALRHVCARTVEGFFNGFIDMTTQDKAGNIYLIDYKSNRLGENADAYTGSVLDAAMAQHHYAVQAVIYALATRRYLITRNVRPATLHIRYLFVRGMAAHSNQGVWAWDIDCAKLAALDTALAT